MARAGRFTGRLRHSGFHRKYPVRPHEAVAAVAAVLGLKCRLVQESWTRWDEPVYDKVGNILLSRLMGAETLLEGGRIFDRGKKDVGASFGAGTAGTGKPLRDSGRRTRSSAG